MAEIEVTYSKLKYIKSDLQFYSEKKGAYESLIGGKGYLTLSNPSPMAKNFFKNATPSSDGRYGNDWYYNYKDNLAEFGTNISRLRTLLDYPTNETNPTILYLYTTNTSGLYFQTEKRVYYEITQGNIYCGIFYGNTKQSIGRLRNLASSQVPFWTPTSIGFLKREDGIYGTHQLSNRIEPSTKENQIIETIVAWGSNYITSNLFKMHILPYIVDSVNPYEDGGDSEDGGGDGDFDNSSEDIDVPTLPTSSATASGFVNIYAPTLNQLNQLASFMWTTDFYDNIVKLWADPMSVILGLSIVPVNIPVDDVREVKCGNVSTGVSMYHASTQFVVLDCGTINVNEYWGAYLDYSPYTKIQLYLPYCGTHSLDIDDIMGRSINVTYHIDILSGSCVAFVKSSGKGLNSVLYEFSGNVSTQIPVTGENFSRLIQTAISSVASLGSTIATGGLSAPMTISTIGSLANNVANSKPEIERSGSMSGSTGLMGIQKPYLILTRPKQCIPKNVQKFKGFPSMKFQKLSDVKGFTIISEILLKNITASDEEIAEIKNLLKEGVIL